MKPFLYFPSTTKYVVIKKIYRYVSKLPRVNSYNKLGILCVQSLYTGNILMEARLYVYSRLKQ